MYKLHKLILRCSIFIIKARSSFIIITLAYIVKTVEYIILFENKIYNNATLEWFFY